MYKILIVDDEPYIREGLTKVLNWEEYGAEIRAQAGNGEEALDVLGRMPIDIVLTDIKMPVMDGLSLIKAIRARGMNVHILILSGHDDFAFVKEAALYGIENYLLKPIDEEELAASLVNTTQKIDQEIKTHLREKENLNILRDTILTRWVTRSISHEELLLRADLLSLPLQAPWYRVSLLRFLPDDHNEWFAETDRSLLSFALRNIATEIFDTSSRCAIFTDMHADLVLLTTHQAQEEPVEYWINRMRECIRQVKALLHIDLFATVGSAVTGATAVHESYQDARMLQEYHPLAPNERIVLSDDIRAKTPMLAASIRPQLDGIRNAMQACNEPAALSLLDGLFRQEAGMVLHHPAHFRQMLLETVFVLFGTIQLEHVAGIRNMPDIHDWYTRLDCETTAFWKDWINRLIRTHIMNQQMAQSGMNPVVRTIISRIERQPEGEYSLKTIANEYNINAAYLGQIFRSTTGELFSAYVTRIRLEKAKDLLMGSTLKTGEIAARVGFPNASYFSNLFRKWTGMYPTDYKRAKMDLAEPNPDAGDPA